MIQVRKESASVTMLTPYPSMGVAEMASASDSALNWYSRRLAHELSQIGVSVSIVGPRSESDPDYWNDLGVKVFPSYERQSPGALLGAFRGIARANNGLVHVQHEMFAFGGLANALLMPALLASIKARGLRLLTTIHGVIPLSEVSNAFVRDNRVPGNVTTARLFCRSLIGSVARLSDKVHVHEPFLQDILVSEYGVRRAHIEMIPLGIEPDLPKVDKLQARRHLGLPPNSEVALFFGFMSAYKGINYLLSELPAMLAARPRVHVVIAGEVPKRLQGTLDPRAAIAKMPTGSERVHLLGFVPDALRHQVFGAADVLLLPHTIAMSSSGPLALSAGYDVPVLMSDAFRQSVPEADIFFSHKPNQLVGALNNFFDSEEVRAASYKLLELLRKRRSWPFVAQSLARVYESLS